MKDESIESLRGIAIIGVVMLHAVGAFATFLPNYNIFLKVLFRFCVPLFIFISGYFVYKKKEQIKGRFTKYFFQRFKVIGIPYFLMTLLIAIGTHQHLGAFIKRLLTGTASVPYYYVIVIFQLYALSKLTLYLYSKYPKRLMALSLVMVLGYSFLFYVQILYTKVHQIFIPYFMWQFPNYYLWFILGIDYSANGSVSSYLKKIRTKNMIILSMVAFVISFSENLLFSFYRLQDGDYIALSTVFWVFTAIVILWRFKSYFNCGPLRTIGNYSFGIFLIHYPIMEIYFKHFEMPFLPQYSIVYMLSALILSMCILFLVKIGKERCTTMITGKAKTV